MNINVGDLVKNAVPESEGRNVRVMSQNTTDFRDGNFLSKDFPRSAPKLYITGETDDFDEVTLEEWRNEGFDVEYFSVESCGNRYAQKLKQLSQEERAPCKKFGIIAFDTAAALCLEHFHVMDNNPEFKLGLLVAYYPDAIPDPKGKFPNAISTLVHFAAGAEVGVTKKSQMIGIQGKRRTRSKRIDAGLGTGGKLQLAYPSYTYQAEPGFSEHDVEEFDGVCAELAWSRSLSAARKVFGIDPDLELVLEKNLQSQDPCRKKSPYTKNKTNSSGKFFSNDIDKAVGAYTTHKTPHVTNIPSSTGGMGIDDLQAYYSTAFTNPPSTKITLLSRTIGVDRVVDEMHIRFKHTQEVPWMLPDVPATDKKVEILVVSIVALKGGKLYQEHVYWDQASVLVQIGLLDPQLLPQSAKDLGLQNLPIVGRKAARTILSDFEEDEDDD